MTTRRLLRELDSQEIGEQMAFDLLDRERTQRPAPESKRPTLSPPRARQTDDEFRAHAEAVFSRWPGVRRIGAA